MKTRSGMSLSEILVALGLGAALLVLIGTFYTTNGFYLFRAKSGGSLQSFTQPLRRSFAQSEAFVANLAAAGDAQLSGCLAKCGPACAQVDWRPLRWGVVDVRFYDTDQGPVNDGARFHLNGERCAEIPPTEIAYRGPPLYPPGCVLSAFAEWRAGPERTVEFRVRTAVAGAVQRETLFHYQPSPATCASAGGTIECPEGQYLNAVVDDVPKCLPLGVSP